MVVLKRTATVVGSRSEVFQFIADWTHITRWDPGTLESHRVGDSSSPVGLGSEFDLVTEFKGSKSNMRYRVEKWVDGELVRYAGESTKAVTVDDISFRDGPSPGTTVVDYQADIRLKGWLSLFGFAINGALQALGDGAIKGIETACAERFSNS